MSVHTLHTHVECGVAQCISRQAVQTARVTETMEITCQFWFSGLQLSEHLGLMRTH